VTTLFAVGAKVLVRTLRRRGTVVAAVRPGLYRVQIGGLMVTAPADDLEPAVEGKKKKRPAAAPAAAVIESHAGEDADALRSLDLHGLTVDEARNRVAAHISRAIVAGLDRVDIIHGIGTGRLKAAITRDLHAIAAIRAVKPHPTNPGITVAYL
jgi:DNA mismatch repair protein MutS2